MRATLLDVLLHFLFGEKGNTISVVFLNFFSSTKNSLRRHRQKQSYNVIRHRRLFVSRKTTNNWRHDTQHNDIQHNDNQLNDIQHIDIQHNYNEHYAIQHNDIQHNNE